MADSLQSFIEQARLKGVQLSGAPKKELTKKIQKTGQAGKKITAREVAKAKKYYATSTKGAENVPSYLSTVGRTFAANQLTKDLREKFKTKGYTKQGGYFVKPGAITGDVLGKAQAAGYNASDIRELLASNFAKEKLDEQVTKFMGEGDYVRDPNTGTWGKKPGITVTDSGITPEIKTVLSELVSGIYAGISPEGQGKNPAEIEYATIVDPYKIQAKSGERLGALQAGTNAYLGRLGAESSQALGRLEAGSAQSRSRLEAASSQALARTQAALSQTLSRGQQASAERLARLQAQAEKDITRSQQATELLGKKMAYGTEHDLAKINRLTALQQANVQQATNLYNLIPSAF